MILLEIIDILNAAQGTGSVGILLVVVYLQWKDGEAQKSKLDAAHQRELESLKKQIEELTQLLKNEDS